MHKQLKLQTQPIFQKEAKAYIDEYHRHHIPPVGMIFAVSVTDGQKIVGVATVGRPVSRHISKGGLTLEVTRLCTDGTPNACSCLYAAAWRTAQGLGYKRLITYTLESEAGTSLKAAGWHLLYKNDGGSWDVPSRPREDKHPTEPKLVWSATPKEQFESDGGLLRCEEGIPKASRIVRQRALFEMA
jgi:hypothetical protein